MLDYFGRRSTDEGMDERESAISSYDYDDEEFEMLVKAFMQDIHYTTVNQAAMNIACSMVNAGLVALPFVAQEAGIPLFFFSMLALSVVCGYTSVIVVSMANERRVRTLEDLAECAYGINGFLAVSIMQLLFSFSLMIITLNVWADIMSDVFRHSDIHATFLHQRHYQIYFGAAIILPLCVLKKSMSTLRWTSFVTILAMAGAFIAVIATYVSDQQMTGNYTETTVKELCRPKGYWWAIIFISVYSFSCNQKVLTIYSSLRRRTAARWQVAMQRALTAIFLLYTLFGICGYIAKDRRDIRIDNLDFFLSDLHEQRHVFDPARALVAFSLLITLPVDSLVAATTWRRLWAKVIKRRNARNGVAADQDVELTCCAVLCAAPAFDAMGDSRDSGDGPAAEHDAEHDAERGDPAAESAQQLHHATAAHARRKVYHRHSRRSRQSHGHLLQAAGPAAEASSSSLLSGVYRAFFGPGQTAGSATTQQTMYSPVQRSDADDGGDGGGDGDGDGEGAAALSYRSYDHSRSRNNSQADAPRSRGSTGPDPASRNSSASRGGTHTPPAAAGVEDDDLLARPANSTAEALFDQYNTLMEVASPLPEREQVVPTLVLWLATVTISLFVRDWTYLAGSLGTLTTVLLLFIIPALLYGRLRLVSDFEAIPVFGAVLPNQLYMATLLVLGVLVLLFDVLVDSYFYASGQRIFQ